jgi:hypothetical protein
MIFIVILHTFFAEKLDGFTYTFSWNSFLMKIQYLLIGMNIFNLFYLTLFFTYIDGFVFVLVGEGAFTN